MKQTAVLNSAVRHGRLLSTVALMISLALGGCGKLSPQERMARAEKAIEARQFTVAVVELKSLLVDKPDDRVARERLGNLYLQMGAPANAVKELKRAYEGTEDGAAIAPQLMNAYLDLRDFKRAIEFSTDALNLPNVELTPSMRAELTALRGHAHLFEGDWAAAATDYDTSLGVDQTSAEALLGRARLQAQQGKVNEANALLDTLLQREPGFARAWLLRADIARFEGKLDDAETAYSRALKTRSGDAEAHVSRGIVRALKQDFSGANEDLTWLAQRAKGKAGTHFLRGVIAFFQERYSDAEEAFYETVKATVNYPYVDYYMALTQARIEKWEQARDSMRKHVAEFPSDVTAQKFLAAFMLRNRELKAAASMLDALNEKHPNDPVIVEMLADVEFDRGNSDRATALIEQLIDAEKGSGAAYLKLGFGLIGAGKTTEAATAFEKAADLGIPASDRSLTLEAVLALFRAQDYSRAASLAKKLTEKDPNDPFPHNVLGLARHSMGDLDGAVSAFRDALAKDPGFDPAVNNWARLELMRGRPQEARRLYDALLVRQPGNVLALTAIAKMEASEEDVESALEALKQAVDQNPKAAGPRILLARAYGRMGNSQQALEILKPVVSEQVSNVEFQIELGTAQLRSGQPEIAFATFKRVAVLAPQSAGAHYMLSRVTAELGDAANSKKYLLKALDLEPSHVPAQLAYTRLLVREGKLDDARKHFDMVRDLPIRDIDLALQRHIARGDIALAARERDEAVDAFADAYGLVPSVANALGLARVQWLAGYREAALQTIDDWIAERGPRPEMLRMRAEWMMASGDPSKTEEALRTILKQQPADVWALNNLAWELRERNIAEAMKHAQRARELAPANGMVMDTLATLLILNGQRQKGMDMLYQAAATEDAAGIARVHLAKELIKDGEREEAVRMLSAVRDDERSLFGKEEALAMLKTLEGAEFGRP